MNKDMKAGSLVKIISTDYSGNLDKMVRMIGNVYRIKKGTSGGSVLVNRYYWDPRDLKLISSPEKEKKVEIFDIKNLVTGE